MKYLSKETPKNYVCDVCNIQHVKLWRRYQCFLNYQKLFCVICALKDQNEKGPVDDRGYRKDLNITNTIGWLVPAVPTEEEDTYWGYTSIPKAGILWWENLPTNSELEAEQLLYKIKKVVMLFCGLIFKPRGRC